jgi:transcriptional regulator with XRE-family HTH domain
MPHFSTQVLKIKVEAGYKRVRERIEIMADDRDTPLVTYLLQAMKERHFSSERAFAIHAGISPRTLGRILRGKRVDPESLILIADGLRVPVENLYRLIGYLPAEEAQNQVLREIETLLRQLPEADQRRILDVVRVEHRYHQRLKPKDDERTG